MHEAIMLGQVVLMGDYVNRHLPATLAKMMKGGSSSGDVGEMRERVIRHLEQEWSDGVSGKNVFSDITRRIVDRARRLTEAASTEPGDAEVLDFTRNLLQLGKREHLPEWKEDRYLISEQGKALAGKLQAYLNKLAQGQEESVSSEG